jgi:hypothetical protein
VRSSAAWDRQPIGGREAAGGEAEMARLRAWAMFPAASDSYGENKKKVTWRVESQQVLFTRS